MADFVSFTRTRFVSAIRALAFAILLFGLGLPVARATNFTLTDANSNFKINTSSQTIGYEWNVDGRQHLNELSNWYRIGNAANSQVNGLTKTGETLLSPNELLVSWADPLGRFLLDIEFTVVGYAPGSGKSKFGESIKITNTSASPLEFHFIEYVDLDLDESPNDDTLLVTTQNSLSQTDPNTIFTGSFNADRYEVANVPTTKNKLLAGMPNNLNSVWPAGAGPVGPGNVAWALQWDFVGTTGPRPLIMPGDYAIIAKTCDLQMLIPEPATWTMALLGALGLWLTSRRARSRTVA